MREQVLCSDGYELVPIKNQFGNASNANTSTSSVDAGDTDFRFSHHSYRGDIANHSIQFGTFGSSGRVERNVW
jgi:hypothetical protein